MKRSNHKVEVTIGVTPASAWEVIGAVSGVDKWLGQITSCRVEGNKRYCGTEHGEFSEDILKIDHENKVLKYSIPQQHMIPVENIVGQFHVLEAEDNRATIEWSWNFDVTSDNEGKAKEMLSGIGNMGIKGIENYIISNN